MVALDVQVAAYFNGPLGARHNAKATPLTQVPIDPDKALLQKSISY
jgi:hypothetical protein